MAKCKNKVMNIQRLAKPDCSWLTLYAGDVIPEGWMKLFLEQGGEILEESEKPVVEEKPLETQPYTEKDIYSWNRKEQLDYLKEKDIKPARTEKGRVEQILKAQ